MEKEFEDRLERVSLLNKTHFPKSKLEHNLIHMQGEIKEVLAEPEDLEEWADILICYMVVLEKQNLQHMNFLNLLIKK